MTKNKIFLIGGVVVFAVVIAVFCATRYCGAEKPEEKQMATESKPVVFYTDEHPVKVIAVDKAESTQKNGTPTTNDNIQVWIE